MTVLTVLDGCCRASRATAGREAEVRCSNQRGSRPGLFGTTQDQAASRLVTMAKMMKPMMKSDKVTAPPPTNSRNAFMILRARSADSDPITQWYHHP
jgi:hypothetical protein